MTDVERRQIGPYRVIARSGAGGMGEVFTARDAKLDRIAAEPSHILVVHDFGGCDGHPGKSGPGLT
jgi:hypothetical protein